MQARLKKLIHHYTGGATSISLRHLLQISFKYSINTSIENHLENSWIAITFNRKPQDSLSFVQKDSTDLDNTVIITAPRQFLPDWQKNLKTKELYLQAPVIKGKKQVLCLTQIHQHFFVHHITPLKAMKARK